MGKIFYVMGKSASGKDTIYKKILEQLSELKTVTLYTTRPIRDGEKEGVEYYYTDEAQLRKYREEGRIIEERTYETVYGPWTYFTADDGQIDLKADNYYLMIGTLESYEKTRKYFGKEGLIPIYVEVEDGIRLKRAIAREESQKVPKYKEMCRRFLADEDDFKEENLMKCGIVKRYENHDFERCLREILGDIKMEI
jgi:guanylate kinase